MLLNLIKHQQPGIDKFYVKDPSKSKYHLLINGIEKVWIENLKNPNAKAFTDYSQAIDDVYENLEDYNPTN